jgi:GT2 family glycosyltransferase
LKPPQRDLTTDHPEVSVVVPAYRGILTIAVCLSSVRNAAHGMPVEIIMVESSGDGTAELVRARFPEVVVIEWRTRLSAGQARNVGFQRSKGRFVLCVDQDCVVGVDWIQRLVAHLERDGVGAAGGSVGVANPGNLPGWCVYFLEFFTHLPTRCAAREDNFLIGANSGYTAEVTRQLSFPDQTLGEDVLYSDAIRQHGFRVLYDPTITVMHHNRAGWREFISYCRAMGCASAASQQQLGGRAIALLRRMPALALCIPAIMLPRIAWRMMRAPWGHLARFALLLPACVFGQLVWANAFRRALRDGRTPHHGSDLARARA